MSGDVREVMLTVILSCCNPMLMLSARATWSQVCSSVRDCCPNCFLDESMLCGRKTGRKRLLNSKSKHWLKSLDWVCIRARQRFGQRQKVVTARRSKNRARAHGGERILGGPSLMSSDRARRRHWRLWVTASGHFIADTSSS